MSQKEQCKDMTVTDSVGQTRYDNKKIKLIKYIEVLILSILAFLISLGISLILAANYTTWFLWNDPQLSLISIDISFNIILMTFVLILFSSLFTTYWSLKKIDRLEVCDVINEN